MAANGKPTPTIKPMHNKHDNRDKRAWGQFYTTGNPFCLPPFRRWAQQAQIQNRVVLEPFAGANHIIRALQSQGLCEHFAAYDIAPAAVPVVRRDTLRRFPRGFDVCVTNPPWLARNSASRRRLPYPQTAHDDMYKHCLQLCLQHCAYVAAILPASYLQSGLFRQRLQTYILLHGGMFHDTENPVCLALFAPSPTRDVNVYYDHAKIGQLSELAHHIPQPKRNRQSRFNDPHGALGFISFDNTREASIRFCDANEIDPHAIKTSSRFITRISGDFHAPSKMVVALNGMLAEFRSNTGDVFLTPFKGMRKDGQYRRRMDFAFARRLINAA